MPKILISGNGFDLHHYLPTTYSDFMRIANYVIANYEIDFNSIYENSFFNEDIKANYNNDVKFDLELINEFRSLASENLLFNFFKQEYEIETWIDFETKIEYILNITFAYVNCINHQILKRPLPSLKFAAKDEHLDNNIEMIEILKLFKLLNNPPHGYSQGFTLEEKFFYKKYGSYIRVDYEKISNYFIKLLDGFIEIFNLYLQIFIQPLYKNLKVVPHNIFRRIDFHFTFNYTPTLEKLYNITGTDFLHGKTLLHNQNIVLGVNDIDKELCTHTSFIKFTKYYQKFQKRTDYRFLSKLKGYGDFDNYEFYFWGHSLDRSDSDYINEVFDLVSGYKGTIRRIIIIYHSERSREKLLLNLYSIRTKEDIEFKIRNDELLFLKSDSSDLTEMLNTDIDNNDLQATYI
ncbi:AbiH family protein [Elizabethkingia anophelis]|uniref:AbiH family protein n=1 Tax=Elizabethkingia anophelis TaxID=1117645 RepID=UPI0024E1BD69|nr:AbiH family protein [Elizabethkingia anophelis]CAH1137823.1 hypothetical protein EAVVTKC53_03706 [Elizabethkingia anophelis]CAI9684953.1 hypothetical protein EAVVTKC53_02870 [Elizabethkingia anophelis]